MIDASLARTKESPNTRRYDALSEKLRQLYSTTQKTAALNIINATALAAVLYPNTRHDVLFSWLIFVIFLGTVRVGYCFQSLKSHAFKHRRADWFFVITAGMIGAAWGCAGAVFGHVFETASFHAVIFMIAGMTAGSVTSLAYYRPAFFAFTVTALFPLAGHYILIGDRDAVIMACILVIYFLSLSFGANAYHRSFVSEARHKALLADKISQVEAQARRLRVLADQNKEAAKKAEIASEAKTEFLARMSHELRTPLNGILGAAQILGSQSREKDTAEWVNIIRDSGDNLLALLNDILDISMIEEGKITIKHEDCDIERLLNNVVAPRKILAREKGVELTLQTDIPDRRYRTDGKRLRQIFTNLVNNAIKFTDSGSVAITAKVQKHAGPPVLFCSIKDTGCGVGDTHRELIFERFSQADNGLNRRYEGAGLGLSISRELAELLGGSVEVKSEPGRGSEFAFTIPMESVETRSLQKGSDAAHKPHLFDRVAAKDNGRAPTCLAIDDNALNRKVIASMAEEFGLMATTVDSGENALAMLEKARFDIIFLDVHMPNMNGIETLNAIRQRESGDERTPIIAVTADAMRGDREKFLGYGFDGYIAKPVNAAQLTRVLEKFLTLRRKHVA